MTTKFGRVPLWLYEAGISLQAVATYGWLAGRYGHYTKITPSYGTLAKELGVSRGSVINYVTALIDVGAVRIVESGADGQTSNTYEIAFERAFPTEDQVTGGQNTDQSETGESGAAESDQVGAGQNTDQSPEVVSGLTGGGQNTDQGGQPVVHEEDVLLDKNQTSSSNLPPEPADHSARGSQEEEASCAPEPHPDVLAVIADVDLGGMFLIGKAHDEVVQILTRKLAEGWTPATLKPKFKGCTRNASNPPGVFAARVHALGAPPKSAPREPSVIREWCGECGDRNPGVRLKPELRTHNGLRDGTPCPRCHPSQTGN